MTYRAIDATTLTLTHLLVEHFASDAYLGQFFTGGGAPMVVSTRTPQEMATADQTGLSLWLYRIARDPELMNHPRRRTAVDQFEKQPLPLRLHYLMTPIVNEDPTRGNDPGMEQSIIGKVLQTLHDHPRLSGADLRGDLVGTESVLSLRLEPLGIEEITRVWDALEASYQLCVSYEVSVVLLHSDSEASRIAPVDSVEPEFGVIRGATL